MNEQEYRDRIAKIAAAVVRVGDALRALGRTAREQATAIDAARAARAARRRP